MRDPIPRQCFLAVHDALKKVQRDGVVSAFVTNRGKFQSDMLFQMKGHQRSSAFTHDVAMKLQTYLPHVDMVAKRQRIDLSFPGAAGAEMSVQLGMQNVSVGDVNAEPEHEDRLPLRSSLGYDEERFMVSAPKTASLAAVLLEKHMYDHYATDDFHPSAVYWLAHCYRMMETYPNFEHHQIVFGSVLDKFWTLYDTHPFDNPYCPGEDMNTMRKVKNICRAMHPMWDGSYDAEDGA